MHTKKVIFTAPTLIKIIQDCSSLKWFTARIDTKELHIRYNCQMEKIQDALLFSHDRVRSYATDAVSMFNIFMSHMMPFIVREFSKIDLTCAETSQRHVVQFANVTIHRPLVTDVSASQKTIKIFTNEPLYPQEARARGLTYSCHVMIDVEHAVYDVVTDAAGNTTETLAMPKTVYREVPLLSIPVMLRSQYCHLSNLRNLEAFKECEYDQGGYFIVRGNPKVIQPQKTQRINVHIVRHNDATGSVDAEIRSLRADEKFRSTSTLYMHYGGSPATFRIDIPFLAPGMPLGAVFRALGLGGRDEIEAFLWDDVDDPRRRLLAAMYDDPTMNLPLDEVYTALGHGMYNEHDLTPEKCRRQVQQQINGELLPHVGFDDSAETRFKKAIYLRVMVLHMLDVYTGKADPDDRDFEGEWASLRGRLTVSVVEAPAVGTDPNPNRCCPGRGMSTINK